MPALQLGLEVTQTNKLHAIFTNEKAAIIHVEDLRWPNGVCCLKCNKQDNVSKRKRSGYYRCNACKHDFRVTSKTICEGSRIKIHKWLRAINLLTSAEQGKLTNKLVIELRVTPKTARRMLKLLISTLTDQKNLHRNVKKTKKTSINQHAAVNSVLSKIFIQHQQQLLPPNMNRIICGDTLTNLCNISSSEYFDLVIADPPYNIGKDFGNNSDSMKLSEYVNWSKQWIDECLRLVTSQGLVYIYGFSEIMAHISVQYPLEKQRWLIWHYTNKTVPNLKFWQRSHETILCMWKGDKPKIFVDEIREGYSSNYIKAIGKIRKNTPGRYGKKGLKTVYNGHEKGALPRDVLKIAALAGGAGRSERWFMCRTCGGNVFPPDEIEYHRNCDILKHPTQKPFRLTERLISSVISSTKSGRVLIPFAGSGSECVVAKHMKHEFLGIEINKEYVKFANKWLKHLNIMDNNEKE